MKLQFDPFELDTDRAELRTASGLVKLEPKAFRLLCLLVENSERVIGRNGRLVVRVEDPAWASQLRWMEHQVVATLREGPGFETVRGLDVRVGPADRR